LRYGNAENYLKKILSVSVASGKNCHRDTENTEIKGMEEDFIPQRLCGSFMLQ
jgi:hypothetical protein